jgi:hypothetical protein
MSNELYNLAKILNVTFRTSVGNTISHYSMQVTVESSWK